MDREPTAEGNRAAIGNAAVAPEDTTTILSEPRSPWTLQTSLLATIFATLFLIVLYFAGAILLPIIFAFLLNLLLQPGMAALRRLHVPKTLAALGIIVVVAGGVMALGFALSRPAADWLAKGPEGLVRLEDRFSLLIEPVASVQKASKEVEKLAEGSGSDASAVTIRGPGLDSMLFSGTRTVLTGLGTIVLLLFFLLVSGDLFLRKLVEVLPTLSNKKQAVDISREIERNISVYLVTITMMNAAVGLAVGITSDLLGLSNPMLWGTMAFALNYILILGPLVGAFILFCAALLTFDSTWHALVPAAAYLAIHFVEGAVTPLLLARRFELNPVLVIVSLIFWYWMWGISGALVAVPLLAIVKIICDRIEPLMAIGHFLSGENHDARGTTEN